MGPTLWVRCPQCRATIDTGFRIPASRTVIRGTQVKTCTSCGAAFEYGSRDTFNLVDPVPTRGIPRGDG